MGALDVYVVETKEQRKRFVTAILKDMKALDLMLERNMFERDNMRIGAEQEFCFVDKHLRPAMIGLEVLALLDDSHFTTELAKFNLEANLDPIKFTGDALSRMENQLYGLLQKADQIALDHGARILLTGILPTIKKSDLEFENITPYPRYHALNDAMKKQRGGDFEFNIKGTDELVTKHNSMLFEACNTSFQVHLQVNPDEVVDKYNWAQAIAGPVLAACTNSVLLFGKRLWDETRIAVFEQTVDLKNLQNPEREIKSRVDFGSSWLEESITEIFQHDVAYHKLLLAGDVEEDAMEMLRQGKVPKLTALSLFNGTIYKWNRACYGITDGLPHIRIENRYIPAGPTVVDEMANTAFWLGLMEGMPDNIGDIANLMDFDHAKLNFIKAAQMGLGAQFRWKDGKRYTAQELILNRLLPQARIGLEKMKIDAHDIDKYLGIIENRVLNHQTGSIWASQSFTELRRTATVEEAVVAVTAGMLKRQQSGNPVHTWSYATMSESGSWENKFKHVHQVMSKELYTVQSEDQIALVTNVMNWRKIHHVPVENEDGEVVGIISSADILKYYCKKDDADDDLTVNDIMTVNPITVTPDTCTIDALKIMRKSNLGCLPVVKNKKLIGILTEFDFVYMAEHLFEELSNIEAKDNHII
ncbi:CBS domain-containing protein [Cryomorpha ignava]|uniref:CBS domain-containing protein n=1 Tax=Cryomorpha ignava TaxID=101383 RepID=A0A7K3WT20_9FLAO|nr:CBS domain-containing protein [Cryomorpha ignava]NEN24839.1 CBS domain-containing protein [Cryomorpha ignava]